MAKVTYNNGVPSWELDEEENKVWEQVSSSRYSREDNEALLTSTNEQAKSIYERLSSTKYKDRNTRVQLQKDLYSYQNNLARLRSRGYDTKQSETDFQTLQEYADMQTSIFSQFSNEEEYNDALKANQDASKTEGVNDSNDDRTWFQKGAFEDGYQFGDVVKTVGSTVRDLEVNLKAGAIGIGEKTVDAGAYILGGVAGMFGADKFKENMKEFISKDLYDEKKVAEVLTNVTNPAYMLYGNDMGKDSVLGDKIDSLAESGGQLIGQVALQAAGIPWWVTSGVTSFGVEVENAFNQGATYKQAGLSAAISAGVEVVTEKLFGGSGLGEKGLINLELLTKGISNKVAKALVDLGVDITAEGIEEVASQFGSNFASKLYREENLQDILFSEEAFDGYLESFVGGAALGGFANVGKTGNSIVTGRDYRTGLTENEQKVFDKVYADRLAEAEKSGKLTQRAKSKIYDSVLNDMEKGYISTDTIEEVLGGETYKTYKDTVDSEDSLLKEYEELGKKKNATLAEQSRYAELSQQIKDINENSQRTQLKSQLSDEVLNLVKSEGKGKGSRLLESYHKRAVDSVVKHLEAEGVPTEHARIIANIQLSDYAKEKLSASANNAADGRFDVSADGKTTNLKTGGAVSVKKIDNISESGEANLTLDDGMVVKASDLAYGSDAEAILIENISNIKLGKKSISTTSANALYQTAMSALKNNPDMTANEAMSLIKGLEEAYVYGAYNFGEAELIATNEDGTAKRLSGELTEAQRKFAYELGAQDRASEVNEDQKFVDELKARGKSGKKAVGKVVYEDGINVDKMALTDTQKANLEGVKLLAKISSIEFHVFCSEKNGNTFKYTMPDGAVTSANGWYIAGTNEIWVDLNAGNVGEGTMIRTAAHEISHYIKEWSPVKWKAMADLLMKEFAANSVDTESMLNEQIDKIKRRYKNNKEPIPSEAELRDMAFEELVSDALSDMLTDGSIVNFMAKIRMQDRKLWQKIKDAIKSLLNKWGLIIDDYKGRDLDTAEAQALSQLDDTFKKLQDMYRDAFMDANEAYSAVGNVMGEGNKNSNRSVDSKRKSYYNEFQTNAMQWAYSAATKAGDTKILSVNGKSFALLEATEDGYIEIARGNYKEVKILEQQYREPDDSVYVYTATVRNAKTRYSANNSLVENHREHEQGSRQIGRERLQADSTRNNEHLRPSNKGESKQQKLNFSLRDDVAQNKTKRAYSLAKSRDSQLIAKAEEYESQNWSRESIFEETGLVRDPKGIWLYELDDRKMKFYPKGDVRKRNDPDYEEFLKYENIVNSYPEIDIDENGRMVLTEEQKKVFDRYCELIDILEDRYGVGDTLKDYVVHEELFEKYPQIADAEFRIHDHGDSGRLGSYDPENNIIRIDQRLYKGELEKRSVEDTIIHEIQHALQTFDERQNGSNEEYWNARLIKNGHLPHNNSTGREMTPYEAYSLTAGEIEAREVSQRRKYGEVARKEVLPSLFWNYALYPDEDSSSKKQKEAKYSIRKSEYTEADYSMAVEKGDTKSLQRMVDAAAEDAGYTERLYHQTDADFTEFNTDNQKAGKFDHELPAGIFLKPSDKDIGLSGKKQMELFAKLQNPLHFGSRYVAADYWKRNIPEYANVSREITNIDRTYSAKLAQAERETRAYISDWKSSHPELPSRELYKDPEFQRLYDLEDSITEEWESKSNEASLRAKDLINEFISNKEYDGVIIDLDQGSGGRFTKTYIAFDSSQLKSADPVTYDDYGDVIPLSERFDEEELDIRYSQRNFSYDELVSKPDMKLTAVSESVPSNRADVVAAAKRNAAKVGKYNPKDGSVSVYVDDINTEIILATKGLRHGLQRTKNAQIDPNYIVTLKAGEIIRRSIKINEMLPSKAIARGAYVLVGAAKSPDGKIYIVRFVVNQFNNELASMDVLYAINAKKEELAAIKSPRFTAEPLSVTSSTISISNLLDLVNKYFPDVLPEDVLRHYGYDARPDGDLGGSALFSERDPDASNRAILAKALESAATDGDERNLLRNYKTNVRLIEAEQEKLSNIQKQLFTKGGVASARRKELQAEAKETAKRISDYDAKLLRLEAMQPIKDVLNREKERVRKRQKQKDAERLREYKKKAAKSTKEIVERNQQSRKKAAESRRKTAMREKIKGTINELHKLLTKGSKERNIKIGLQQPVAMALEVINMDTVGADERVAKYNALIAKATDPDVIASLTETRDRIQAQGNKLADKLVEMREAYAEIRRSGGNEYAQYYKQEAEIIENAIADVIEKVGDTSIRNMSLSQLESVYDMYRLVLQTVRYANELHAEGKAEELRNNASSVMTELEKLKPLKEERAAAGEMFREFSWNEMIPVYAFRRIGSATLEKFFWEMIRGQSTFAADVEEANRFAKATRKKFGYDKWNLDKIHEFKLKDGRTLRVSLRHMMSIYAYSKRDQALDHMSVGGFFFNDKDTFRKKGGVLKFIKSNEKGYTVNHETLKAIIDKMNKEAKGSTQYVDDMQDYLTKMGEKGNEVSRVVWGIDIFKEKVYFPLKSSKDFIYQANQPVQESSLKHDGMTKETKPGASNPIILEAFDEVWASHVTRMSQYHGFVIPIDNMNKLVNYGSWAGTASVSISTMLRARFGESVNEYLNQFIKDLNGASSTSGAKNPFFSFVGKFKKTAVAASTSVVVQQPTAIIRATAVMDAKYFVGLPEAHSLSAKWNEVKKYAPIAIIKEIGGFDAGAGRQATEWLNFDAYRGIEKIGNKIDDITMKGAAIGDQIGWCTIWEAVKREIKATTNLKEGSEEFLKKVGERFTEVIVLTQVYDSTLSRSGYMRSKHDSVKMLTAFMGEPTVSINMMYDAVIQGKRKIISKQKAAKIISATYASVIVASVAASLIYALRDDDEDESYLEKFAEALGGKLIGDLNPLNMLPGFRDLISIFDGWEVERTDMAVFKDIKDAFDGLTSENKSIQRKIEDFAGAIASLFGLPLKNVLRTGREIEYAIKNIFDDIAPSDVGGAFVRGIKGEEQSNVDKLYDAISNGDDSRLETVKDNYSSEEAYNNAVKDVVKRLYGKGEISESEATSWINELYPDYTDADIYWKLKEWKTIAEHEGDEDYSYSKYGEFFDAIDSGDTIAMNRCIQEFRAHNNRASNKEVASDIASAITSHYKPLYTVASSSDRAVLKEKVIEAHLALGYSRSTVVKKINNWSKD